MNYMAQIAKILGVEIGEEFDIYDPRIKGKLSSRYRMWKKGIEIFNENSQRWEPSLQTMNVLTGKMEIAKRPWKPQNRERFWYVAYGEKWRGVDNTIWCGYGVDLMRWRLGNCYRTEEAAKADLQKWEKFFESDERIEWENEDEREK